MIEAHIARVNGIMEEMRYYINPDNERLTDYLDRLEMAVQDLEQEAIENEERLNETKVRKVA